jgi:hypothetical protein
MNTLTVILTNIITITDFIYNQNILNYNYMYVTLCTLCIETVQDFFVAF